MREGPLVEAEVLPLMAQVEVGDPLATTHPQWERGDERAVAIDQVVAVATRPDTDGAVTVVVEAPRPGRVPPGVLVFDGSVLTTGDQMMVGNGLAGVSHAFDVGPGWHPIRIFVAPAESPSLVTVVVVTLA